MIKVKLHKKNNWLEASGYSLSEEAKIYEAQLEDIMKHTRWYLDHAEFLPQYKVSWVNYSKVKATVPFSLVTETKRRKKRLN